MGNLIGLYDSPEILEYKGEIYLRSAAVPFAYSDEVESKEILWAIYKLNQKAKGFELEYQIESNDSSVWCSVIWPIENWFWV